MYKKITEILVRLKLYNYWYTSCDKHSLSKTPNLFSDKSQKLLHFSLTLSAVDRWTENKNVWSNAVNTQRTRSTNFPETTQHTRISNHANCEKIRLKTFYLLGYQSPVNLWVWNLIIPVLFCDVKFRTSEVHQNHKKKFSKFWANHIIFPNYTAYVKFKLLWSAIASIPWFTDLFAHSSWITEIFTWIFSISLLAMEVYSEDLLVRTSPILYHSV